MTEAKTRSYKAIIHTIASFCLSTRFENGYVSSGHYNFRPDSSVTPVRVGDLIALQAAPTSDWAFSWVIEIDRSDENVIGTRYLLESILTGELVWWSNVFIIYLDREKLQPHWRWTDRQWAFCDRWMRVCRKRYYSTSSLITGLYPEFHDDNSVTLKARYKYLCEKPPVEKIMPNWKKVTLKVMAEEIEKMDKWREVN